MLLEPNDLRTKLSTSFPNVHVVQNLRDQKSFKATAYDRSRQSTDLITNINDAVLDNIVARPGTSTQRLALPLRLEFFQ